MKTRIAKKQIKKVVGYMSANGLEVVNVVCNPEYTGGTCVKLEEDCYKCEITYTRKRYGAPVCPKFRHSEAFFYLYGKIHYNN